MEREVGWKVGERIGTPPLISYLNADLGQALFNLLKKDCELPRCTHYKGPIAHDLKGHVVRISNIL